MSRKVTDLINDRLIGEGTITEGKSKVTVSGLMRKAALMQMGDRADDDGCGVWLSLMRIAVWIECNERHARRVLRSLEADGLIKNTGQKKVMSEGAVLPVYDIVLDKIRSRPDAYELLIEKSAAKAKKNERDVEARRRRRATMARQSEGDGRATVAESRATMARSRATMASEPVPTAPKNGVASNEATPMSGANAPNGSGKKNAKGDLFGDDASARGRGRRTPMVGESEEAGKFWDDFRNSDLWRSLPQVTRDRCRRKLIIEQIAPILAAYDRDLVARVVGAYYTRQKKTENGARAAALQTICEDGRLVEWLEEAKAKSAAKDASGGLSVEEAMRRLGASVWRPAWGDKDGPEYDEARALMAQSQQQRGGDIRARA